MFRAFTLVTFAAATLFAAAAQAEVPAPATAKQVTVHYADLDIGHRAGAGELIARLNAAAAQACGPAPDIRELELSRYYRQCIADAVTRGVESVNTPAVTELFHGGSNPGLAVAAR